MKYGFSRLAARTMPAQALRHGDCGEGMVTCPECRMPVFKVERVGNQGCVHYLSHYRKGDDDALCELRVNSLTRADVERMNSVSQGQTLDAYYQGIDEMLSDSLEEFHVPMAKVHLVRRNANAELLIDLVEARYRREFHPQDTAQLLIDSNRQSKIAVDGPDAIHTVDEEVVRSMCLLLSCGKGARGLRRISSAALAIIAYVPEDTYGAENRAAAQRHLRAILSMTPGKYRKTMRGLDESSDMVKDIGQAEMRIYSAMQMLVSTFDYKAQFERVRRRVPTFGS
jgi:hypothetical protein